MLFIKLVKRYISLTLLFYLLNLFIFFSAYLYAVDINNLRFYNDSSLWKSKHVNILLANDSIKKNDNENGVFDTEDNTNTNTNVVLPDLDFKKERDDKNIISNNKIKQEDKNNKVNVSLNNQSFFNSSKIARNVADISREVQDQHKLKHGKSIEGLLSHRAIQAAASYENNKLSSFLNHYGNINLNIRVKDNLSLDSLSFDYLLPFYVTKQSIGFTQIGYHDWDKRHLFNTGIGYRALYDSFMLGVNIFLDKDITLGYRRLSLGVELGKDYLLSYGNYYFPVSVWHRVDAPAGYSLESSPAEGWDLGIKTVFPFYPFLSGSVGFFQWYGHHVDLLGGFNENVSAKKYRDIESNNPCGIDLSLEYKPFSLLSAEITEKLGADKINDLRLSLNINFSFDQSLSQQLTARSVSHHMLNALERAFVRRNQHMVLDYRENPVFQKRITVLLEGTQEIDEKERLSLNPYITTAFPVVSYAWEGAGAQFLDKRDIEHPVFTAPFWAGLSPGRNEYNLSFTASDVFGRSYTANTIISVKKNTLFDPTVLFYADQNNQSKVSSYNVGYREVKDAPTIYWQVNSRRFPNVNNYNKKEAAASLAYRWEGDTEVLVDAAKRFPIVNANTPVGQYLITLVITTDNEGISRVPIPVSIYSGEGRRLKAGADAVVEYSPRGVHSQPASGINTDSVVTYESSNISVGTVDDKGMVTIIGAGITRITVTESPSANFKGDQDSYQLTVSRARTGLAWDNISGDINNGQVVKEVSDATVDIPAIKTAGSDIEYTIEGDTAIASLSDPALSEVVIHKAGEVKVVATQVPTANYLGASITYSLIIGKSLPVFNWSLQPTTIVYSPGGTDQATAISTDSDGGILYASSNSQIADINYATGEITVYHAGTTIISALLFPSSDGKYTGTSINYALIVTKAVTNDTLSFHGVTAGGTITRNFGDADFVIVAVSTSDSEGAITYESSVPGVATVNADTGLVSITGTGSTVIKGKQVVGINYPAGEISYTLTVNAIAATITWTAPVAAVTGTVVVDMNTAGFTVAATSNSGGAVTYSSSETGVANIVNGNKVNIKTPGTTTITAHQTADGNYTSTDVSYTLVVNATGNLYSDLSWNDAGGDIASGRVTKEFGVDTDYTITASSTDNLTGVVTYEIVGNSSIATIAASGMDAGKVTLGNQAGIVTVVATQVADGIYIDTRIEYLLQVNQNQTPLLTWDSDPGNTVQITYGSTTPIVYTASSSESQGVVTYSSSNSSAAAVNEHDGVVTLVGMGTTTITATLSSTNNHIGESLSYDIEVTRAVSMPDTVFKWSSGVSNGDTVSFSYDDTAPHISAIAADSEAVISYASNTTAEVDVAPTTGILDVKSITSSPVTITASYPATSKYAAGSITYKVTVTPIASNLAWDDSALLSGERTLAYGEALTVTATGDNSGGAVTYTATGGAAIIVSTTGVITTVAIGTSTITATQAADGNHALTTVAFELTVTAASVSLTWDEAGAVSGVVGTTFDAASYQSQVTSGGVAGATTYALDPGSTTGIVTVASDTGIVTFDKAGQVRIIATFTPDDNVYAVSTTGYDLVIGRGQGLPLAAGNDREESYAVNGTFTQTAQGVNPGATVTYQTTDDTVATVVAGTGVVTIVGVGVARIIVTEAPTDQYKRDQSSYQLTVVAVNTDLAWDDADAAGGRVIREVADGTVDIQATHALGSGAVTYSIVGDATVAEILSASSGVVTIHKAGAVKVVATQAADSNYLATSVSYDLLVGESAPDFTWTTPGATSIEYSPGATDNPIAGSSNSDGAVVYESSNAQVADINRTTGVVTIYHAGITVISALLSPSTDGKYTGASIDYTLTVDKAAANTTLSFHGVAAGSTITRNFGDADFTIAAVSTSDSEGAITYESSIPGVATVNADTGLVSIAGTGSTVIKGKQAVGINYPAGEISYTLTVNAIAATITWTAPVAAVTGTVVVDMNTAGFTVAATSNSGGGVTYSSSETGVADIVSGNKVNIKTPGTTIITASQAADGNYTSTDASYTLVVNATGSLYSDLSWDDGSGDIVSGRVTKEFGVDTEYTLTASSTENTTGAVTYEIAGDSAIATIIESSTDAGKVTLGSKAGIVTVVATQVGDGVYTDTRIEYLLQVTQNQTPSLAWDSDPGTKVTVAYDSTTPIVYLADSLSSGTIIYSSSDSSVAAVNELNGAVTLVGVGTTTITATLPVTNNYIGDSLSYDIEVTRAASTPDTVFKWSSGITSGDTVTFAYDATAPHISAIAPDPEAVISYASNTTAEVDVAPTTGILDVKSITSSPVTITASYPATSKYAAGSITYKVTVTPIASNLAWDDSALISGERTLAYGEALTVTATGDNSGGGVTYTATGGAATIVSTTGVITTVAIGTSTITATQAADGNHALTTVAFELTVTAASVSLTWDEAGAISGVVGTTFDAAGYQAQVSSDGVAGTTAYTVDPSSTAGIVTVASDTGIVTFDKAGQVRIIATFTPNDNVYAESTTGYDLVIGRGQGLPLAAGNDREESYAVNGTFTQTAQGVNPGATVTYQTTDDTVATVVAGTGVVTIVGVGVTRIIVTEAPTDQYKRDQSSYQLTVVAVNTDLAWDDADAASGRVIREVADGTVDIQATHTLGSGAVTYSIVGDVTVAEIQAPASGEVTLYKAGAVRVVATQAAGGNYLATSVSYDLLIGESAPNFTWTTPGTTPIEYSSGATDNPIAGSSNSDGAVVYESSNSQVADINRTTGVVTIYHAGTTVISALLSPSTDGKYTGASIDYTLTVDKAAANTTLSFHGVTAGGTITRNFGDADFVIAAVSTSDSEGAITYESSVPGVATVNADTGLVSITGTGSTVIKGKQAVGINYPAGEISYTLTVNAIAATITWTAPVAAVTGTVVVDMNTAGFTVAATSNSGGGVTYSSSETGVADIVNGNKVNIKTPGTTIITASQAADGNYTSTDVSYTLVVNATGSLYSDLSWDDGNGDIVSGRVTKEFGVDTDYTITASSTDNITGVVAYEIVGNSSIATIAASGIDAGKVTLGNQAGIVTVVATQVADGIYIDTRIEYLLQVNQNQTPLLTWDSDPGNTVQITYGSTTPIVYTASSSESQGVVTYSSSNSSAAAVNEHDGVVTLVGMGTTTITATLSATNNYIGESLSYDIEVTRAASTPDTVFKWSSGISNGDTVSFAYDATATHISAIAPDPDAVISYLSDTTGEVDVASDTGILNVKTITTAPVTITASYAATSKYAAGSITYKVTVTPIASNLAWDDSALLSGERTLAYGEALTVTATGDNSGGAVTYTATGGAATIVSTTGVITTVAIGTSTITATQAADGNHALTTVAFELTVTAASVSLTWDEAGAVSGVVGTTFDAASYQAQVSSGGVAGTTAYTVDPSSTAGIVTVASDTGIVTFDKAGQVRIIATFTPNDNVYAESTTGYDLVIGRGQGLPLAAGNDREESYVVNGTFTQTAQGVNPGATVTYQTTDDTVATVVAGTGVVTIVGVGVTRIIVTEAPTDQYKRDQSSYQLTVVAVNTDLAWDDADAASGRVIREVADGTVDIQATHALGSGAVTYSIVGDAAVAEILAPASGEVTLHKAGAVKVVATQAAGGNYLATSVSYDLLIGESVADDFDWQYKPDTIAYSHCASYRAIATSLKSDGSIIYESSDAQVADINKTTGVITVYHAGTSVISALLSPSSDGKYAGASINYTLTVTEAAANDTLSFHGVTAGSTVTRNFGDADFVIAAVSTSDSEGAITYASSEPGVATVSVDTGLVSIAGKGSTVITAKQAAGTNYPAGMISYILIVNAVSATMTWTAPSAAATGTVVVAMGDVAFSTAVDSNSGGTVTYSSSETGIADITGGNQINIKAPGTTTITASQTADGNYTSTDVSYTLVVNAAGSLYSDLSWDDGSGDIVAGRVTKEFGVDTEYTLTASSTDNLTGAVTYEITGDSDIATIIESSTDAGKVTLGSKAGIVTVVATQVGDAVYTDTRIEYLLQVTQNQTPSLAWDSDPGTKITVAYDSTTPIVYSADSLSSGTITYSSSDGSVAAVNELNGAVTLVGVGETTVTATLPATNNYVGGSLSYDIEVTHAASTPDSVFKWSSGILAGDTVSFAYDATAPHISAIAPDPEAVISYASNTTAEVDVASDTGILDVKSITSSPVTITASYPATSKYAAGSITYKVTVTPIASNLAWDDSALLSGERTLAYGEALTVTATGDNSGGAVTYTATGGAATIVSTTGVITTVAIGTSTITATQAADGNHALTTVAFELTVTAASVSLTWDEAGAVSGVVGTTFDAAGYQAQVSSGGVAGTTAYTVDPSSTAGIVTVASDTGIVTFDKAGQVRIIATFTPNDNVYAESTTGYDLVIGRGQGLPLAAGNDREESYVVNGTFTQTAQGVNPGATVTYQTTDDTVATVVAGTGVVTIVGVGVTRIIVTEAPTDQYKRDQSSYQLTVVAVNTDLAWDDADAASGRVIREVADGTVDISATHTLGSGAVTYSIVGDVTVAEIQAPASGEVTLYKAGAVRVVATQAAGGNYLATSVSYDLLIGESAPNFTWTTPGTTPIEYSPGATDNPIAGSSNSDGAVVYESSNAQVADINRTTGVVTIYHAGTTVISALLSPSTDGKYAGASIDYTLTVDKAAANTTLSFHGVAAGGTITRNFGDADFTIAAVSTSDSEGAITYESSVPGIATVNADTGLVSIAGKGSTVIKGKQAAGINYPAGEISYTLTVNAIAATITWTSPANAATGTVVATEGDSAFTTAATSNAGAVLFTYTSSDTGVADITVDQVTVKSAGTTVITASHPAAGNYTATESSYTLVVNAVGSVFSDLSWDDDNGDIVAGRVTKEFGADILSIPSNHGIVNNNTTGAITYEIVGDGASGH